MGNCKLQFTGHLRFGCVKIGSRGSSEKGSTVDLGIRLGRLVKVAMIRMVHRQRWRGEVRERFVGVGPANELG